MTGININAGFEVGSANPIDTRQWLSTADMKNADVNTMPDPYFAINKEDHFLYIFSKANPISESTGYFTKYTNDGGMTVWKGSEAERDALREETKADESIIFYTWDTASAEYKNVVSKTVGTVENMREADYQALETKDARTIYTTETGIRVGENYVATNGFNTSNLNFVCDGDSLTEPDGWRVVVNERLHFKSMTSIAMNNATWACRTAEIAGTTYKSQEATDASYVGYSGNNPLAEGLTTTERQKRFNNCSMTHLQEYIAKVNNNELPAPDVFCAMFGVNDDNAAVGTSKGNVSVALNSKTNFAYDSAEMYTLAGACRWYLQTLKTAFPSCKIFVILGPQMLSLENTGSLADKLGIIEKVAKSLSVPTINAFEECGISSHLETGSGPYLADSAHPNAAGYTLLGNYIATSLRAKI